MLYLLIALQLADIATTHYANPERNPMPCGKKGGKKPPPQGYPLGV